jgi:hypothetical protein
MYCTVKPRMLDPGYKILEGLGSWGPEGLGSAGFTHPHPGTLPLREGRILKPLPLREGRILRPLPVWEGRMQVPLYWHARTGTDAP